MSVFQFNGKDIYYDVTGTGKPIVFLNGIMMSTASWNSFVSTMSEKNMFIRVDFFDQGQSARMTESYTQEIQVEVVHQLLLHLGLDKAAIMGVSYGGEVALKHAIKYPNEVDRLILFNTAAVTSDWLRDIGHAWNRVGATLDGDAYYDVAIPVIYSPSYYARMAEWMANRRKVLVPLFSTKEFQDRMKRLVDSSENHDCRKDLDKITAPTLVVSSQYDFLVPLLEQEYLVKHIKNAQHVIIPDSGHASMYEKPLIFTALTLGFANAKDAEYVI
jgi:pimeloyl-ACP methyl ester carboxylesterase